MSRRKNERNYELYLFFLRQYAAARMGLDDINDAIRLGHVARSEVQETQRMLAKVVQLLEPKVKFYEERLR